MESSGPLRGTPGAGARVLPAKPTPSARAKARLWKRGKTWLVLAAAAFGTFWLVSETLIRLPWWPINDIVVMGAQNLDQEEVLDRAQVTVGVPIFTVNVDSVIERVKTIPWVLDANVTRRFSGKFEIHVTERTAVGLLWQGRFFLIDAAGFITPLKGMSPPDVPLVTGVRVNDARAETELRHIGRALGVIAGLEPLRSVVSELSVKDSTAIVMLLSPKGVPVVLPPNMGRDRLIMVASLVARHPEVVRRARYVDARFAGHLAVGS